ncbi:MAG: hypothetical protein GX249_03940 [Firmicutes bacterium]|nr:hypothetical protein [Bacillota bacterium]
MIVNSERTIALTCPACQGIQQHTFSLFSISQKPLQLMCDCGFSQGHLRRLNKHFELDVLSIEGDRARILLPRHQFFGMPLIHLLSPVSGLSLGYLGDPPSVAGVVLAGPADSFLEADDFANPEVMRDVLKALEDLATHDKIRCDCDHSSIGIDVYFDQVELVCAYCGSVVRIGASTRQHQERIARVDEIVMEPCTSLFLGEWLKPLT